MKTRNDREVRIPCSLLEGRTRNRNRVGRAGAFGVPSIVVARITDLKLEFSKVTRFSSPQDGSGRASCRHEQGSTPDTRGRGRTASVFDSEPCLIAETRLEEPQQLRP